MSQRRVAVCLCLSLGWAACSGRLDQGGGSGQQSSREAISSTPILLPTGAYITPVAALGSTFQTLNPGLSSRPDFIAGQAVTAALGPDGRTLLVLTSGYNRNRGPDGRDIPEESNEYVFIFDASVDPPAQRQVIQVHNTFDGIAWMPSGDAFLVSGGADDNVHIYRRGKDGSWAESLPPIDLDHKPLFPLLPGPQAAGIAVSENGESAVVVNFENDSVSVLDLNTRSRTADLDLRPGKIDKSQSGVAGGEFPTWVAIRGNDKAYVSSTRDREVVVIDLPSAQVIKRIGVGGQPNRMILNRSQSHLFVSNGSSDSVSVVDTSTDQVLEQIPTAAPRELFPNSSGWKGANPNSLALSPDERYLYVTNGGTNSIAVVRLGRSTGADDEDDTADLDADRGVRSQVVGLIPTGWYPNSVVVSSDGSHLFVVNGKSVPGPDPGACRDTLETSPPPTCTSHNQYVLQTEKAGLLSLPVPIGRELARLTRQVGINNHFVDQRDPYEQQVMEFLRGRIRHVIYIIKENRTYDQMLGDLEVGNGDPDLTLFNEPLSPNHHALARQFVTLDAFFDSGEVSGVGWNWSTGARTTDIVEKTQFLNYAGRGLTYDWEGTNRNINVGLPTAKDRQQFQPLTPDDPDLFPGAIDDVSPEGPGDTAEGEYLWDAALRRGLWVRNYGCYGDLSRYQDLPGLPAIPIVPDAFAQGIRQFFPTKAALLDITDVWFRGYDQNNADYYNFKEWEREFDQFVEAGEMPALEFVRFPHDHFGAFTTARYGVNTPAKQIGDNDYAIGLVVDKIAHSPFANDTLVFILEDDAQDGPDHVDAHRSVGYVVGPYVRQGAVISRPYNTVNMIRTIEEVLGLDPMGLTDGLATPMTDVFEPMQRPRPWSYDAIVPEILRETDLPVPPAVPANPNAFRTPSAWPIQNAEYWERATAGQDFSRADAIDGPLFNRILWRGIKGDEVPYPVVRDQRDLSVNREQLLLAN
jgi:YVTN family beta-propeller protein